MGISNVITLLGGVALFLFGMSLMGDGLKKVAGNKLEIFLYKLSNTPLKGILLGTGVTAVIQSSSATSVMVVGFVNSGMMQLTQAISIIMGAVIGTSVTGWVISLSSIGEGASGWVKLLSTETLAAIVALIGIYLYSFTKKKSNKHIGNIMLGFAVLMMGMQSMSGAVSGLRTSPTFINLLTTFSNPVLAILFGLLFTTVLQSASAAVGILQALTSTGAITFDIALPIIMGIAIGAAVPVLLSAIGAGTAGKRAALSYIVINSMGAIIVGIVFYAVNAVVHFSFMGLVLSVVGVAIVNSVYRVVTIVLLSPFIKVIEKVVCSIVKDDPKASEELKEINSLEERFLKYPPLAIEQSRIALVSMAEKTLESIVEGMAIVDNWSEEGFAVVEHLEGVVDKYEDKIGAYITKINASDLDARQSEAVSKYLHTITDLERMSDHALNLGESAQELQEKKIEFTEAGRNELNILETAIMEITSMTTRCFIDNDIELAYRVEPLEDLIDDLCDIIKAHHIDRLSRGECTLMRGYVFNDLLTNFERIADHCSNIAIAMIELESEADEAHEYISKLKELNQHDYEKLYNEYKEKYALE